MYQFIGQQILTQRSQILEIYMVEIRIFCDKTIQPVFYLFSSGSNHRLSSMLLLLLMDSYKRQLPIAQFGPRRFDEVMGVLAMFVNPPSFYQQQVAKLNTHNIVMQLNSIIAFKKRIKRKSIKSRQSLAEQSPISRYDYTLKQDEYIYVPSITTG